ncbi:MAG: aspartate kinase, partial [Crocinitomicaceae bacterium]
MSRDIRVFKFGGASVKDADAVVNVAEIIRQHMDTDLIIVVSAMGKTTNKLEDIFNAFVKKDKSAFDQKTQALKQFHLDIAQNLFGNAPNRELQQCIEEYFDEINDFYEQKSDEVSHLYDQLIPYGEILSTKIIHYY